MLFEDADVNWIISKANKLLGERKITNTDIIKEWIGSAEYEKSTLILITKGNSEIEPILKIKEDLKGERGVYFIRQKNQNNGLKPTDMTSISSTDLLASQLKDQVSFGELIHGRKETLRMLFKLSSVAICNASSTGQEREKAHMHQAAALASIDSASYPLQLPIDSDPISLEATALQWIATMRKYLSHRSQSLFDVSHLDLEFVLIQTEITHWKSEVTSIELLLVQYTTDKVQSILQNLYSTHRLIVESLDSLVRKLKELMGEYKTWISHLHPIAVIQSQLVRLGLDQSQAVNAKNFRKIIIFIHFSTREIPTYATKSRMISLIKRLGSTISDLVIEELQQSSDELFSLKLQQLTLTLCDYKDAFMEERVVQLDGESSPWQLICAAAPFGILDVVIERLSDITEMRDTRESFIRNCPDHVPGLDPQHSSALRLLKLEIQNATSDTRKLLDATTEVFSDSFNAYRVTTTRIGQSLFTIISEALDSNLYFPQALRIIKKFSLFRTCSYFRAYWRKLTARVQAMHVSELQAVRDELRNMTTKGNLTASMDIPLRIAYYAGLSKRVVVSMSDDVKELELIDDSQTSESISLRNGIQSILSKELLRWSTYAEGILTSSSGRLLKEVNSFFTVALNPEIPLLLSQAKRLRTLPNVGQTISLPPKTQDLLQDWDDLRIRFIRLEQMIARYNEVVSNCNTFHNKLLSSELKDVKDTLGGYRGLPWSGGKEVDYFMINCERAINRLSKALSILQRPTKKIKYELDQFSKDDNIFPLNPKLGSQTLKASTEWQQFYNKIRLERKQCLKTATQNLLYSTLTDFNTHRSNLELVDSLNDDWLAYSEYVKQVIFNTIKSTIKSTLESFNRQLDRSWLSNNGGIPLISCSLVFTAGELYEIQPSISTLRTMINQVAQDVLSFAGVVTVAETESLESDVEIQSLLEAIKKNIELGFEEAIACKESLSPYLASWGNKQPANVKTVLSKIPTSSELHKHNVELGEILFNCEDAGNSLRNVPPTVAAGGWLLVDIRPVRGTLAANAGIIYRQVTEFIHKGVSDTLSLLEVFSEQTLQILSPDMCGEALSDNVCIILERIREVRDWDGNLSKRMEPLLPAIGLLRQFRALPLETINLLEGRLQTLPNQWRNVIRRVDTVRTQVAVVQEREIQIWLEELEVFTTALSTFIIKSKETLPISITSYHSLPYDRLSSALLDITAFLTEESNILQRGKQLESIHAPNRKLQQYLEVVKLLKAEWDYCYYVLTVLDEWRSTAICHLDEKAFGLQTNIETLKSELVALRESGISTLCNDVNSILTTWSLSLPTVKLLRAAPLRNRHWGEILITNCGGDYMIGTIIDASLTTEIEYNRVKDICNSATAEQSVETKVFEIRNRWTSQRLPMKWCGGCVSSWILDGRKIDRLLQLASDDILSLQQLATLKATVHHLKYVKIWLKYSQSITDVLNLAIDSQQRWLTVISVLGCESYLPAYQQLRSTYVNKMALLHGLTPHPDNKQIETRGKPAHLWEWCCPPEETSRFFTYTLQTCLSALEDKVTLVLEASRRSFPRLNTLSTNDLARLLKEGDCPSKTLQSFWQVAPGCAKVIIEPTTKIPVSCHTIVTSVAGIDGTDKLNLRKPFECKGPLAQYFAGLLNEIQKAVSEATEEAFNIAAQLPKTEWVSGRCTQVVLTTSRLCFTAEVETAFDQIEDGNASAHVSLLKSHNQSISVLCGRLKGTKILAITAAFSGRSQAPLPASDKRRISALLVTDLHHRDLLSRIVSTGSTRATDLVWASSLRFKWDEQGKKPTCYCQFQHAIPMGNEFVPLPQQMMTIQTPQTDRCISMIMLAYQTHHCAVLCGETASGKTQVVKDLTAVLNQHLIVVVSSEATSLSYIVRNFSAAFKIDAWLLIVRCEQLSPIMLSSLGHQVVESLQVRREGGTLCTVLATMGKREGVRFPESLRRSMRLVSLVLPDLQVIAEVTLTSFGMKSAASLAAKIGSIYHHGKSILPNHSWSLPSLRALMLAVDARRHLTSEVDAVLGAIYAVHVYTMVRPDTYVAIQLISAAFPGEAGEPSPSTAIVKTTLAEHNYSIGEGGAFAGACARLATSLTLRKANCIIGPPGCGKSVCWKIAAKTLQMDVKVLFPNAMGVEMLEETMRSITSSHNPPGILVLDCQPGPWLDELSHTIHEGALHDSGLLQDTKTIIEASTLSQITPGILSRVGIVVVEDQDVSWLGRKDRWVLDLPAHFGSAIDFLCDAHLSSAFEWRRKSISNNNEMMTQQTLQRTVESLILCTKPDATAAEIELLFAASCLWSLGSSISVQSELLQFLVWFKRDFALSSCLPDCDSSPFESFSQIISSHFSSNASTAFDPFSQSDLLYRDLLHIPEQQSLLSYASLLQLNRHCSILISSSSSIQDWHTTGSGKTSVLQSLSLSRTGVRFISGCAKTTPSDWKEVKDSKDKDDDISSSTIIFIDDLHVTEPNVLESIREELNSSTGGRQFICTAATSVISPRLLRHMSHLYLEANESLWNGLAVDLSVYFHTPFVATFKHDVRQAASLAPQCLVEYLVCVQDLFKVVIKTSISNLIIKIIGRIKLASSPSALVSSFDFVSLFRYEVRRVVIDSMLRNVDAAHELLDQFIVSTFEFLPDEHENPDNISDDRNEINWVAAVGGKWMPKQPKWIYQSSEELVSLVETATSNFETSDSPELKYCIVKFSAIHIVRMASILDYCKSSTVVIGERCIGKCRLIQLAARMLELDPIVYDSRVSFSDLESYNKPCFIIKGNRVLRDGKLLSVLNAYYGSRHLTKTESNKKSSNLQHSRTITPVSPIVGMGMGMSFMNFTSVITPPTFGITDKSIDIKVVLCCSFNDTPVSQWARTFPSLFQECQQYVIPNISQDTRFDIGKSILGSRPDLFSEEDVINSLVSFCVSVHMSAKSIHPNCFTQSTYLDMLHLIVCFAEGTRQKDSRRKQAVKKGISKLQATAGQAVVLERELQEKRLSIKHQTKAYERSFENLEHERKTYHEHAVLQNMQQRSIDKVGAECVTLSRECAQDLSALRPTVDAAFAALKALDKNAIMELKTSAKPTPEIINVCIAIYVLTSEGRIPKDKSWNACKKIMVIPAVWIQSLMSLDCNNIPQTQADYVSKFIKENKAHFSPAALNQKSLAAGYLCTWLLNMLSYHETRLAIRPKEERLAEFKAASDNSKTVVNKMKEKTKMLKENLNAANTEVQQCEDAIARLKQQARSTESKLMRAKQLMQTLGSDGEWAASATKETCGGTGDIALAAALVSHGGVLSESSRKRLLRLKWPQELSQRNLPHSKPILPLVVAADIALWENNGLPAQLFAQESATVIMSCRRSTLLIDPHKQGTRWLINQLSPISIRCGEAGYETAILQAASQGCPVVITDVGTTLPQALDEMLENVESGYIVFNGSYVPVAPKFRMHFSTQQFECKLPVRILCRLSISNFNVGMEGIEEILLSSVVDVACPALEQSRQALKLEGNQRTIDMQQAEQELLHTLSTAEGELLDKPDLVAALNCMKQETSRMEEALQKAIEAQQELTLQRDRYRAATGRGALLFMQVQSLEKLNPMYAFSIEMYIQVFKDTLLLSVETQEDDCDAFEAHRKGMAGDVVALLANEFSAIATRAVFLHIVAGLKKEDKLVFSAALCFSILGYERPDEFPSELLTFLLKGPSPTSSDQTPSPISWLPDDKWNACQCLEGKASVFTGLTGDIIAHNRWHQWYLINTPELEVLPGEWQVLGSFHKLLVLRCLRPDRLPTAVECFMKSELGSSYVDPPQPSISDVLINPKCHTVILWTGLGNDPLAAVKSYHNSNISGSLVSIDVHDELSDSVDSINRVALKGGWCMLDSIHLEPELLPLLSPILTNSEISPRFLMVLTADPASASKLPVSVIRDSLKVTTDTSSSLKSILLSTWDVSSQHCPAIPRQGELRRMLFLLSYFHSVCLQRNIFLNYGFVDAPYAFGTSEISASRYLIQMLLQQTTTNTDIHWDDLREVIVSQVYAAHSTVEIDRKALIAIGESILTQNNLSHSDFCGMPLAMNADVQEIHQTISGSEWSIHDDMKYAMLNTNSVTAMHRLRSVQLCEGLHVLVDQVEVLSGNNYTKTPESHIAKKKASQILKQLPVSEIDTSNINNNSTLINAWIAEVRQCNIVIEAIRSDLNTNQLEPHEIISKLVLDEVPSRWSLLGFETTLGLASWVKSLLQRELMLRNWVTNPQIPRVVLIHLLFNPKAFLVKSLIAGMRSTQSLDSCHFAVEISKTAADKVGAPARNGIHIWGVRLLMCKWSPVGQFISQSSNAVTNSYSCLPVVTLRVSDVDEDISPDIWPCPIYSTASRRNIIINIPLPSKKPTSFWTLIGACAVLEGSV